MSILTFFILLFQQLKVKRNLTIWFVSTFFLFFYSDKGELLVNLYSGMLKLFFFYFFVRTIENCEEHSIRIRSDFFPFRQLRVAK